MKVTSLINMSANPNDSLNQFGYELFQKLAEGKECPTAFSPYSVYAVLMMVAAIAKGEGRAELMQALHIDPSKPVEAVVQDLIHLTQSVECDKEGKVTGANSIWPERKLLDKLPQDAFKALEPLEAALNVTSYPEPGVSEINAFVNEKTHGLIPNLLSPGNCPPGTFYILVNCLYFIDRWLEEFPKQNTKTAPFHTFSGDVNCEMMYKKGRVPHFENDAFQFVMKPYKTTRCSMLIALPKNAADRNFMATLTPEYLRNVFNSFNHVEVHLRMPKFTVRTKWNELKDGLQKCGINKIFTDPCLPGESFANDAIQEAVVIVDEEKTEAAAATAVMMMRCAMVSQPITMTVDHPFGFFILNNQTKTILFMGAITDPTKEA